MKPILFLVGQTATGKSDAALAIAKTIPSLLISADSRQVYKGMEIGTGALLPASFSRKKINTPKEVPSEIQTDGQTEVWLQSCIQPDEEWSTAHFVRAARWCLQRAWDQHLLPIVVGGTGLYTEHLLSPPQSLFIPPNPAVRQKHSQHSTAELQSIVQLQTPHHWARMNESDKANPRRLIRALEVSQLANQIASAELPAISARTLWLGLRGSDAWLHNRIKQRVEQRVLLGMKEETLALLQAYPTHLPSLSATGYPETIAYLQGKISQEEWYSLWTLHEQQYAKRQATWFAKRPQIQWCSAETPTFQRDLIEQVKTWYNATTDEHNET